MQHNFWNKFIVQSKTKRDVSGPSAGPDWKILTGSGTNQNAPFPSWTGKPYNNLALFLNFARPPLIEPGIQGIGLRREMMSSNQPKPK